MRQMTIESLADTTSFSPLTEPRPPAAARLGARSLAAAAAPRSAVTAERLEDDGALHPSSPIAERFCGALALSALLGFGSATLLAHGAAADSGLALSFGACGIGAAALLQLVERRRAKLLLTQAALQRGLDPDAARSEAQERLRAWLS